MQPPVSSPAPVLVPGRCNGALESGNGGYSCGVFAALIDGPADVSLRRPVPLDRELTVALDAAGARVLDGAEVVALVEPGGEIALDVPRVSPGEARAAAAGYRGSGYETFARCYVCGLEREDALGVFAGAVPGGAVVASPWTPPDWAADARGRVLPEHVWAVMDCPTYFAAHLGEDSTMSFLVRMGARLRAPVVAGMEHVVVAWPLGVDGRKRHAASAVLTADGEVLALARVLLVEAR
jgi:hypothetical protein